MKFEAEGREFAKRIEITRTIYSDSKRSEQSFGDRTIFQLAPGGFSYLMQTLIIDSFNTQLGLKRMDCE